MLTYPHIDPIAFSLGPIDIYWYGLMYLLAFAMAWALGYYRARQPDSGWTTDEVSDLIFYGALGAIAGGRLGYMLFYGFDLWSQDPFAFIRVWEGGMSFHGGLVGAILALLLFARKTHKPLLRVTDFAAPLVPLGLAAGRMGNFINGELWGRVTDVPWAMIFPYSDGLPRHPSQLYEFFLEGLLLFVIVWCFSAKPRPAGAISGLFLVGYAVLRSIAEYYREPDLHLGFLAFGWLTMGQLLCIPMLLLGIGLLVRAYKWKNI
jgi:phosphatidylglycerol:prolipoprotein diacylglycerol transferase